MVKRLPNGIDYVWFFIPHLPVGTKDLHLAAYLSRQFKFHVDEACVAVKDCTNGEERWATAYVSIPGAGLATLMSHHLHQPFDNNNVKIEPMQVKPRENAMLSLANVERR